MKNILVVAAENSAELYGAQVIAKFLKNRREVRFFGLGGDRFQEKGVDLVVHNKELAVVGIVEVVSSLAKLKRCMDKLVAEAKRRRADAALLIDYPDFNLRLAKKLKRAGIRVYYYIAPTVWAWRYSRVKQIKKYVDHLFIIFPFEIPIYEKEQIPFTYTGHPLVPTIKIDVDKDAFRRKLGVKEGVSLVTLLPGSRKSEVSSLLPEMLEAVERLGREMPLAVCLLRAHNIDREFIRAFLKKSLQPVQVLDQEQGHNLIFASDLALTTHGTSNLEIAVVGTPFVAAYRVGKLSYFLGKRFVKIDRYSIVNIMAQKDVVPELVQEHCTASEMVAAVRSVLTTPGIGQKMREEFQVVKALVCGDQDPPDIVYRKISADLGQ